MKKGSSSKNQSKEPRHISFKDRLEESRRVRDSQSAIDPPATNLSQPTVYTNEDMNIETSLKRSYRSNSSASSEG